MVYVVCNYPNSKKLAPKFTYKVTEANPTGDSGYRATIKPGGIFEIKFIKSGILHFQNVNAASKCDIFACGGGEGGQWGTPGSSGNDGRGGDGGNGGACSTTENVNFFSGVDYTITIGAGGGQNESGGMTSISNSSGILVSVYGGSHWYNNKGHRVDRGQPGGSGGISGDTVGKNGSWGITSFNGKYDSSTKYGGAGGGGGYGDGSGGDGRDRGGDGGSGRSLQLATGESCADNTGAGGGGGAGWYGSNGSGGSGGSGILILHNHN